MSIKSIKKQQGFTIIEVMIVLAIAALIMLIIFFAVPALQRNSRNTQRRSDATHTASLVSEYTANHAGNLPTTIGTGANDLNISNEHFAIMDPPITANINAFSGTAANNYPTDDHTMFIITGARCDNTVSDTSGVQTSTPRSFTVAYQIESGGGAQFQCVASS